MIEHREALSYMLCEAAELEHGIMCVYLFAAGHMQAASRGGSMPCDGAWSAENIGVFERWVNTGMQP